MGTKYKHLYEKVCSFDNLWVAARKARRGKRLKNNVLEFECTLEENLLDIQERLNSETYEFGEYNRFVITDPKERQICAAPYRDRVVHHALCNVIEPILDKAMIDDSYACRIGKGSHRAMQRAQHFLRSSSWVLKMDLKKYFFTIDHELLIGDIQKKISDLRIIRLIQKILATYTSSPEYYYPFPWDTGKDAARPRGLPIGNLTSQIFANYYLTAMDRLIKQELCIKRYVRYMDDALIFGNNALELKETLSFIQDFLEHRRLKLHERKCQWIPSKDGISFLGYKLFSYRARFLRANIQRFRKLMKHKRYAYANGSLMWDQLLLSINGWLGYAGYGNVRFVNRLFQKIPFKHDGYENEFTFMIPYS